MFKVIPNGTNRIDVELSGKLNAEDMKIGLDELVSQSKNIENGIMLYQISGLNFPSLGAIGVELSRLPALFGLIRKFDRTAVLADKAWIKKVSEVEGALFPGLEIKSFDLSERTEAEAWLLS